MKNALQTLYGYGKDPISRHGGGYKIFGVNKVV